jgi:hypothetical protein
MVIEGMYATDVRPSSPDRYLGVRAHTLDDSTLRWVAKRNATDTTAPDRSQRYLDKLSMRRDFDPQSEYFMLEGTSTFSHGHLDGNTIASLTWRNRIWLFDMDYIRAVPREHNGVEITRDGLQRPIPSLTRLEWAADFADAGLVRTSVADYNGANWQRTILWHKNNHFIVRDVVTPRVPGEYRATIRFRTKGEATLRGNQLAIEQNGEQFHIDSGDTSSKLIIRERDGSSASWSQYPHNDGTTIIYRGEHAGQRSSGSELTFLHALYPGERSAGALQSGQRGFYWESRAGAQAGSAAPGLLESASLHSDAAYWWATGESLYLAAAMKLAHADWSIALSSPAAWAYHRKEGRVRVIVEQPTAYRCQGCRISTADGALAAEGTLPRGAYSAHVGWLRDYDMLLAHMAQRTSVARPPGQPHPVAFGWAVRDRGRMSDEAAARPTAWGDGPRPGELLVGAANGEIWIAGVDARPARIATLPDAAPLRFVGSAKIHKGRSRTESIVIAGDDRGKVSCLSSKGELKWSVDLEGDYPRPAIVTSLAVAPIGKAGESTLLLGTEAWNVFAFSPTGEKLWRGFVRYHAVTAVQPFELRPGQWRVAVGTEYHTPLNVLNERGQPEWFTWEQVGSESRSTTDYFGYGLTRLLAHDLDDDGEKELLFGVDSNTLAAVRAADGQTVWSVPVADKVLGLTLVNTRRGDHAILAILADGTLLHLTLDGGVRSHARLDSRVTHAVGVPNTTWHVLALENGVVTLIDEAARIRAVHELNDEPIMWLSPQAESDAIGVSVATRRRIYRLLHRPFLGRPSRHF